MNTMIRMLADQAMTKAMAVTGAIATATLLSACQRPPTYKQPPAEIPQATLTYTSNELNETRLGFADGVSGVYLFHSLDYCRHRQKRPLGDIQQVSKDQPQTTVIIPAAGDLVFETFWKGKQGGCLTSMRAFKPQEGQHYRLDNHVDLQSDVCRLTLLKQNRDQSFSETDELRKVDNYCAGRSTADSPF